MKTNSKEKSEILEEYRMYCIKGPKSYYDYENIEPKFNDCEKYEIKKSLGRGKYSDVYMAIDATTDRLVVIKLLKPVRKVKISREICILQAIKGGPYIIELLDICMDQMSKTPSLIFEHFSPISLKQIMLNLSDHDIRNYMYQIIVALDYSHSRGIMHRDVKPMNIIVDTNMKTLKLIDWGLSEFYIYEKEYNTRVSSRPYKSPELLLNYQLYDFSMDIWSLGCMLAAMLFKKDHFFLGRDNQDQLAKIVAVLGSNDFFDYIKKYQIVIEAQDYALYKNKPKIPFKNFINEEVADLCTDDALDLLSKMLLYDHNERILAREALKHPYFDPIRSQFENK